MVTKKPDEERITGTIKSIDGDVVTVVYQDSKRRNQEIDVTRKRIAKARLAIGEIVTIELAPLTMEAKIPIGGSMLEIEDSIMNALGLMKENLLEKTSTKKKVPAKRTKRA